MFRANHDDPANEDEEVFYVSPSDAQNTISYLIAMYPEASIFAVGKNDLWLVQGATIQDTDKIKFVCYQNNEDILALNKSEKMVLVEYEQHYKELYPLIDVLYKENKENLHAVLDVCILTFSDKLAENIKLPHDIPYSLLNIPHCIGVANMDTEEDIFDVHQADIPNDTFFPDAQNDLSIRSKNEIDASDILKNWENLIAYVKQEIPREATRQAAESFFTENKNDIILQFIKTQDSPNYNKVKQWNNIDLHHFLLQKSRFYEDIKTVTTFIDILCHFCSEINRSDLYHTETRNKIFSYLEDCFKKLNLESYCFFPLSVILQDKQICLWSGRKAEEMARDRYPKEYSDNCLAIMGLLYAFQISVRKVEVTKTGSHLDTPVSDTVASLISSYFASYAKNGVNIIVTSNDPNQPAALQSGNYFWMAELPTLRSLELDGKLNKIMLVRPENESTISINLADKTTYGNLLIHRRPNVPGHLLSHNNVPAQQPTQIPLKVVRRAVDKFKKAGQKHRQKKEIANILGTTLPVNNTTFKHQNSEEPPPVPSEHHFFSRQPSQTTDTAVNLIRQRSLDEKPVDNTPPSTPHPSSPRSGRGKPPS